MWWKKKNNVWLKFSALFWEFGHKNGICGIKTIEWQHHDTIRVYILCILQQVHCKTMQIEKQPKSCYIDQEVDFRPSVSPDRWGCVGEGSWNVECMWKSTLLACLFKCSVSYILYLLLFSPFFRLCSQFVAGHRAGKGRWLTLTVERCLCVYWINRLTGRGGGGAGCFWSGGWGMFSLKQWAFRGT